jgi:hypothetical protein
VSELAERAGGSGRITGLDSTGEETGPVADAQPGDRTDAAGGTAAPDAAADPQTEPTATQPVVDPGQAVVTGKTGAKKTGGRRAGRHQAGADNAASGAARADEAATDPATADKAAADTAATKAADAKDAVAKETETKETETEKTEAKDAAGTKEAEPKEGEPKAGEPKPAEELWSKFAPVPVVPPGRVRRVTGRVAGGLGRVLNHEWTLAALGSVVLAAVMTWPTLRQPTKTIPQDIWDPTLQAWQMAWAGHALKTSPSSLWDANAFYPERYSYAFSDTLLGYAPFGLIGNGPVAAILRYNIVFVLIFALAFFGCYALVRQLGAGRTAAAVGAAAFTYAPWRLGQAGHLHVLSVGGIVLAMAMLARGHGYSLRHGYRPEHTRWGWVIAGWLVAAWQLTIGFGVGLVFAYVLAGMIVVSAIIYLVKRRWFWAVRRPFGLKLLLANLFGGLAFAATGALMAYPYLQVLKLHPYARRSEELLTYFSPPLKGFFIAPPESRMWGEAYATARESLPWAPEMAVLPGFFLYALALAGLFVSTWRVRHRVMLALGVVVTVLLAMGTNGPDHGRLGYLLLYRTLPGFDGIRTPGRLVLWTTLLLAILAAGAVGGFVTRAIDLYAERGEGRGRAGFWLRIAALIPLVLVLVEGLGNKEPATVPPSPIAMHTIQGPAVVLPTGELEDMNVMLWTTDGFPKVANGGSGFQPKQQGEIRAAMQTFPDPASVDLLRGLNFKTVVVVRSQVIGTAFERAIDAPIDGLGIERIESGDVVIYKLDEGEG